MGCTQGVTCSWLLVTCITQGVTNALMVSLVVGYLCYSVTVLLVTFRVLLVVGYLQCRLCSTLLLDKCSPAPSGIRLS